MVTLRNNPFSEKTFRRRITDQRTTIVLPGWGLEREHPKSTGPNDVAAQLNAAGERVLSLKDGEHVARRSSEEIPHQ
jgi:hypothetical protein